MASVPGPQPQAAQAGPTAQAAGPSAASNPSAPPRAAAAPAGLAGALDLGDTGFAAYLAAAGWLKVIALCLLLGLLLSFTPCVLPMVPILLAI
ncbi:MAG: cytochrome c biogenesis protein CcdA, partial [Pollutimonas bauzanensis]